MTTANWFDFELHASGLPHPVRFRLGERGERWIALVEHGPMQTRGLGPTPRAALVAALAPFGARASTTVMAAPAMFAASAELLAAQAAG